MHSAPVLFVSHGAPTFALEPGLLGAGLRALGENLCGVTAVLVVSPHWQTREVRVMSGAAPATIHDFAGFAPALYELRYPAPGHPRCAEQAARLLAEAGFETVLDARRGFDHGAWVPLRHLLPAAAVPLFQVSMPRTLDTAAALRLGRALAPLRQHGVLIIGSGSLTHNLYELGPAGAEEAAYARAFASWVRRAVVATDIDGLVAYRRRAPQAERAHPTEEHYLPLLVALGARSEADTVEVIEGGIRYGVLSMESYAFGLEDPCRWR